MASETFWAAHKEWVQTHMATPIDAAVSDPEEHSAFLSSYTTYKVSTSPLRWMVRRRFSDFEWLRDVLTQRYVGLLIPALPAKRAIGKDASFVRERMAGLNMFLSRLNAVPYLRKDATLAKFLSVADNRDWEAVKDTTKPNEITPDNVGMVKWREALEHFHAPKDADRTIDEIKAKLEALEPLYREAAASAKRLAEKSAAFSEELTAFQSAFDAVATTDAAPRLNTSASAAANATDDDAHAAVAKAGMGLSAWAKIAEFQPRMLSSMVATTLAFEARQISSMRSMLKQREDMLETKHKAERVLDKHNAELNAVRGRDAAKESRKAKQVADDTQTVERASFVVDIITKALLFSELDRLSDEKATLIREMFASYSVSGFKLAGKESVLWKTMSAQMGVDAAQAAANAKKAMDLFSSVAPPPPAPGAGAGAGAAAAGGASAAAAPPAPAK